MERAARWWLSVEAYRARALAPVVALLAGGVALVYGVAVRTEPGQRIDAYAFAWVAPLHDLVGGLAGGLRAAAPPLLAAAVAALALVAVRARRTRAVVAAALAVLGSVAAARLLRDVLLTRPDLGAHGYVENTLPSGHVAAVASLALGALLLWPSATRSVPRRVLLGAAVVVAVVGWASVVTYAHRPSDVLAGMIVAALVTTVACWVVRPPLPRAGSRRQA